MIILYLTCADEKEAKMISDALLEAKLIACAKRSSIKSSYWWDGKINHDDEVLLTMDSRQDKFDAIDEVVSRMHSYDQYNLTAVNVVKATSGVEKWLDDTV
jgi:periplasmic divalent cation tolerance protein